VLHHPSQDDPLRPLLSAVGWFWALSLLSLAATGLAAVDVFLLGNRMGEQSLTETAQVLCLLLAATAFLRVAVKVPRSRGFAHLVSGAFFAMALREQDYAFDFYFSGAWILPVLVVVALSVGSALRPGIREDVLPAAGEFCRTPSAYFVIAGFVLVLAFSRVFTSGKLFWKHLLPPEALHLKTCIQEGVELMGYVFATAGAVRYAWHAVRHRETAERPPARAGGCR